MFISKNLNVEVKRTRSIVQNLFWSEANMFILKNLNIEAKQSKLILICVSSEAKRSECSYFQKLISKAKWTGLF
jgi:hypothetical protein